MTLRYVGRSIALISVLVPGPALADVTTNQVLDSWRHRAQRIHSATFEWTEDIFAARGMSRNPSQPPQINPDRAVVPDKDSTYGLTSKFTFSDGKFRFEEKGWLPAWLNHQRMRSYRNYVSVFDGKQNKTLEGPERWQKFAYGTTYKRNANSFLDISRASLLPLRTAYFVMDPSVSGFDATRLQIVARSVVINGRPCIVMEHVSGRTSHRVYVDSEHEFVIVRLDKFSSGKPLSRADFSHTFDSAHGWILTGWKWTRARDNKLVTSISGVVSHYEINPRIPPSAFDLEYPTGTFVEDLASRKDYIQRRGGEKRYILPIEAGAPYERLVKTDSGQALRTKPSTGWWWVTIALLAISVVGLILWRFKTGDRR